jgi:RNA polymerase sigma factor (sigma-70 family)
MAAHPLQDFIRRLRHARSVAVDGHLSDAQLLERFVQQRDEAAFEVLVWRHGALVLHLARRLLRHGADAEDVFQATFLTLARKAASIRRGTAVGSWLYKVAYRIASRVRQTTTRHERREQAGIEQLAAIAPTEDADAEMAAALADEVNRLSERHRAAVVLCYLQGVTTEEAARVLGCPRGTVLSRLASARQRLRSRLIRRGLAPAVALTAVSFGEAVSAMPTVALVASVVRAALPFAAGGAAVSTVSPQVAALARGALHMMMWNKIKIAVVVLAVIGLAGTGAGWLARGRAGVEAAFPGAEQSIKKRATGAAASDPEEEGKKQINKVRVQLDTMAAEEEEQEKGLSEQTIDARLRLLELKDELRRREDVQERVRTSRLRELMNEIERNEKIIRDFVAKLPNQEPQSLLSSRKRKQQLQKEFDALNNKEDELSAALHKIRRDVFEAEENLRRIETRQTRQREIVAAKREILFARLRQVEEKFLDLQPADRFRDVERKLDALRREVGELRRSLEHHKDR